LSGDRITALFLSPHFDDVALSCGGTVVQAAASGRATVATIFGGQPAGGLNAFAEFQHDRWGALGNAVDLRREEDLAALRALGASPSWLDFPDAIYRDDLYLSDDELFGPVKSGDVETSKSVCQAIAHLIDTSGSEVVYAPLGVGGHVDHLLTRDAAVNARHAGVELLLYEDLPYAAAEGAVGRWRARLPLRLSPLLVDVTAEIDARIRAIAAYRSQLPTIFRHHGHWESVVRAYASDLSGASDRYCEHVWRVVGERS
jgi:LmbE family N-acetylglucosaminyl deacetylase